MKSDRLVYPQSRCKYKAQLPKHLLSVELCSIESFVADQFGWFENQREIVECLENDDSVSCLQNWAFCKVHEEHVPYYVAGAVSQ